ncbi:hypothetical protein BN12_1360001 [Nostocoides japonicum T1-X7]|uniref:Uncharacterized protein n=1 Tax=Nostocoides japonicum T1-X7 TaxID=1194083 RepID=A0A077LT82_9MICO|nr:hypothetical protein BN12_1360001 [Tetrasphaera japonica T1-X7]
MEVTRDHHSVARHLDPAPPPAVEVSSNHPSVTKYLDPVPPRAVEVTRDLGPARPRRGTDLR